MSISQYLCSQKANKEFRSPYSDQKTLGIYQKTFQAIVSLQKIEDLKEKKNKKTYSTKNPQRKGKKKKKRKEK
jgi:hypothetical protein